jgi:hypothetical protein
MNPAQIADSYDQLAEHFAADHLRDYDIRQHERALAFVKEGQRRSTSVALAAAVSATCCEVAVTRSKAWMSRPACSKSPRRATRM